MHRYTATDYKIYVGEDRVTGEYVAIVREFPSLSWVSPVSRHHATDGMRSLLGDVLDDIYEDGDVPPSPTSRQLRSTELRELAAA